MNKIAGKLVQLAIISTMALQPLASMAADSTEFTTITATTLGSNKMASDQLALNTVFTDSEGNKYRITEDTECCFVAPSSKKIKSIVIPDTVTASDGYTYNVVAVDQKAFKNCTKLKSVTLSANTRTIGNYAFQKCIKLKKITIPSKVKIIGKYAFYKCTSLKKVVFKTKVLTTIKDHAFKKVNSSVTYKYPSSKKKKYAKWVNAASD